MRAEKVVDYDYNNGDGVAVTLWVTGCPHKCEGCHNPQLWDKDRGMYEMEALSKIEDALSDPDINKHLSILGGEPLAPYNIKGVTFICKYIREKFPNKEIWLWTGYTVEELDESQREVLEYINVIIDGKFEKDLKIEGKWYGSSNQRMLEIVR